HAWLVRVHRSILPRRLLVATGGLALLLTGRQRPRVPLVVQVDPGTEGGEGQAVPEDHDHVADRLLGQVQLAEAVGDGEAPRPLERAVGEVQPVGGDHGHGHEHRYPHTHSDEREPDPALALVLRPYQRHPAASTSSDPIVPRRPLLASHSGPGRYT